MHTNQYTKITIYTCKWTSVILVNNPFIVRTAWGLLFPLQCTAVRNSTPSYQSCSVPDWWCHRARCEPGTGSGTFFAGARRAPVASAVAADSPCATCGAARLKCNTSTETDRADRLKGTTSTETDNTDWLKRDIHTDWNEAHRLKQTAAGLNTV